MTLLRYLGVGAGAVTEAVAGAGADKKQLYEDKPCPLCGVWVDTCHRWISEKEEKLFQLQLKTRLTQILWQSLINALQLICTHGKRRLTLDHVPFHDF